MWLSHCHIIFKDISIYTMIWFLSQIIVELCSTVTSYIRRNSSHMKNKTLDNYLFSFFYNLLRIINLDMTIF